jgi:hypothetical protein
MATASVTPEDSIICRCHRQTGYVAAVMEMLLSAGCHRVTMKFSKSGATEAAADYMVQKNTQLIVLDHVDAWGAEALEVIPNLFTTIRTKGGATGILLTSHIDPMHWLHQNARLATKVGDHRIRFDALTESEMTGVLTALGDSLPPLKTALGRESSALGRLSRISMLRTDGNWDRLRELLMDDDFWSSMGASIPTATAGGSLAFNESQQLPTNPVPGDGEHSKSHAFALFGD